MPTTIENAIGRNRRKLAQKDAALLRRISSDYETALADIQRQLARLGPTDEIRIAELVALDQQIRENLRILHTGTYHEIERMRQVAMVDAVRDVNEMMALQGYTIGTALDPAAIVRTIAATEGSTALSRLLAQASLDAGQAAAEALSTGVILRENPLLVARRLKGTLDVAEWRLRTIARTEVLRAYRGATRERMISSRVVGQWQWVSARTQRTCAMCWAMDGQIFDVREPFGTHPNCRCSQAPVPANRMVNLGTGPSTFETLSEAQQRAILGPRKYQAYRDGRLGLADLVGETRHPEWGLVRYERSLTNVLSGTGSRR